MEVPLIEIYSGNASIISGYLMTVFLLFLLFIRLVEFVKDFFHSLPLSFLLFATLDGHYHSLIRGFSSCRL